MRRSVGHVRRFGTGFLMTMALIGGSATVSLGAPASAKAPSPPGEKVVIDVVTVNGSGCRKGTALVAVSPDNEAFTVTYSEYLAQVGPETKNKESRKNCKLDLRLSTPAGFTYAIARTDFRGFALLENGATAVERAKYKFQGSPDRSFAEHRFAAPYDGFWQTTDVTEAAFLIFGPCGKSRRLNIDTELEVKAGPSDPNTLSLITMDSTDGEFKTVYRFVWKACG